MRALAARTGADLRANWRAPLAFHLLMQLLGVALFTPIVAWLARRIVRAAGEPVISNYDVTMFVLSGPGVVFVLAIAALTLALVLAEFAGHSWIAGHAIARRHATLASTVATVLRVLPRLVALSARVFARLLLLALPFVALLGAIWFTTLAGHDIDYYLAERPPEWRRTVLVFASLSAGYVLLAAWQLARWVFAVPILVFRDVSPQRALVESAVLTRDRLRRFAPPLVLWFALLTAAVLAVGWAFRSAADLGLDWAGIDARRVLPLVAVYLAVAAVGAVLYGGLWFAGHQFLVTRMFAERLETMTLGPPPDLATGTARERRLAQSVGLALAVLLVLAAMAAWTVAARLETDGAVAITARRGASGTGPEGTLATFRRAMEDGATYAEFGVQRTADGRLVVLHDSDLRLEEVIALVRGRLKLNIELSYDVPDPGLAPAVIELLEREDFLDQALVSSLDEPALEQVKRLEPRLPTGHIVTAAVGNVMRTGADFLSLNSARASTSVVRKAHAAGKDVHVWTVNDPQVMLRMIERGVDNIVTDDPALLARVIAERSALGRPARFALRLRVLFDIPPRELDDPEAVEPL